jgi:hypothetical protein
MPSKIDVEKSLCDLLAWKERQEQNQADRIVEMRNAVIDAFMSRHATVAEIQTVLELVKLEALGEFVHNQQERARIASKEYPAKIKECG